MTKNTIKQVDDVKLVQLAELYKVFGDPTRIRILYILSNQELCVQDIADSLSMTQKQPFLFRPYDRTHQNRWYFRRRDCRGGCERIYRIASRRCKACLLCGSGQGCRHNHDL